ncbi:hypothetical protein VCHENC02_2981A, partial [Vibrio harveyi]
MDSRTQVECGLINNIPDSILEKSSMSFIKL